MSQLLQVAFKFKTPLSLLPPRLQDAPNSSVVDRQGLPDLGSDGIVLSDAMRFSRSGLEPAESFGFELRGV